MPRRVSLHCQTAGGVDRKSKPHLTSPIISHGDRTDKGWVSTCIPERSETGSPVGDRRHDVEKVAPQLRQAIETRDQKHVAGVELVVTRRNRACRRRSCCPVLSHDSPARAPSRGDADHGYLVRAAPDVAPARAAGALCRGRRSSGLLAKKGQ